MDSVHIPDPWGCKLMFANILHFRDLTREVVRRPKDIPALDLSLQWPWASAMKP